MNKKCLIIINKLSGHYNSLDEKKLISTWGSGFDVEVKYIDKEKVFPVGEADRVVVCGGDGTLNSAINLFRDKDVEFIYCPYGTLNEFSRQADNSKEGFVVKDCGSFNDNLFAYVFATGTFTPLGYTVKDDSKQKFKALAYIASIFKQLKVYRINAKLDIEGVAEEGEYCLIMAINAKNCFGLTFNKMYQPNDGLYHLLTVKAPRSNGFFGLVQMFPSFLKAFFIGFKKEYSSKKMTFKAVQNLNIKLENETYFCVDGEKYLIKGDVSVKSVVLNPEVKVVSAKPFKK